MANSIRRPPRTNRQFFSFPPAAGEVGFDLNADHLVADAAPLDSWVQRLGRVNRRGKGDATVLLINKTAPADKTDYDKACINTLNLFVDGMDVSPKALATLKKALAPDQIEAASTPPPTMVELTDILLDAWSMTSIVEPMPGRPEVGPWLRGIADDVPQTTIAWRAELELFRAHPNPEKSLKAIFTRHRVRPHESLTVPSFRVVRFFQDAVKPKGGRPDLVDTPLAIRLPRGEIVIRTVRQLIDDPGILNAEPTLILPATFGGLDNAGMLSADAMPPFPKPGDPPLQSLDVADYPDYEQRENAKPRLRAVIRRKDEGTWSAETLPGGVSISARLNLQDSYHSSTELFADLRKADLRVRLVEPIEFDEEGNDVRSLVMLAPATDKRSPEDQPLADHVEAVEKEAAGIADRLGLEEPTCAALLFAARWHDEGKKADIWQRFVYGPDESGSYKGKSSKTRAPKSLRGYRHEFGSLLRVHHPTDGSHCELPPDPEARDLALHLIATHHGCARPHFATPIRSRLPNHRLREYPFRSRSTFRSSATRAWLVVFGLAGNPAAVRAMRWPAPTRTPRTIPTLPMEPRHE